MTSLNLKKLLQCAFVYAAADDAESSDDACTAAADIRIPGHIVKVYPLSVGGVHNALGTKYHAVFFGIFKLGKNGADTLLAEFRSGFHSPGCENLICMMVMMLVAIAVFVVALMLVVMVMMLVAIAVGVVALVLVVMVMMLVAIAVGVVALVLVVMVMMLVAIAVGVVALLLMMMVMMLHLFKLLIQSVAALDGFEDLFAAELIPGGGDYDSVGIFLPKQFHSRGDFIIAEILGSAEDYGSSVADLIIIKLAKVFHIHFAPGAVADNGGGGDGKTVNRRNSLDNVAELAHAGRLDKYSVWSILLNNLSQSHGEIANERAADTAGVELVNLNSCVLHKSAVNAYLAEFVFNEDDFLTAIGFGDKFFYKSGFTGTQKAGENINFCH